MCRRPDLDYQVMCQGSELLSDFLEISLLTKRRGESTLVASDVTDNLKETPREHFDRSDKKCTTCYVPKHKVQGIDVT